MTSVLVVDDSLENRYLLRMLLQGYGARVEEALNGAEALALAQRHPPSLVITDLLMPVMDGYTLLRQWKASEQLRDIPFMVYTATYTDPQDERLALDLGADAFMIKPAEPEALLACIHRLLAQVTTRPTAARQPQIGEATILRDYSEALFRKLAQKVEGLEATNQRLRQEIAERRRVEADLRDSEARYRQLFEAITEPLIVCDRASLAILSVNEAALAEYGYSQSAFLALALSDLCTAADLSALTAYLNRPGGLGPPGVLRLRRQDGALKAVELTAYRLKFADRPAWLMQVRDVTQQRQLEEQLRQAQKMEAIGRLAGGVAHDFNNLLTVIKGYSDLLMQRLPPGDDLGELAAEIFEAGDRGGLLIRQLLAVSRQQVLAPRVIDLNAVVANTELLLRRLIGDDVRLATHLAAGLPPIKADPSQIEQVLMNLAVNARDAMPQGGTLTLTTETVGGGQTPPDLPPGRYARLSVVDSGCGIDADTQTRMFEPFFTTKAVGMGTGLGLSTVHGIVQQSGGHIAVESAVGQGTTVHVYLPLVAEAISPAPVVERSHTWPQGYETLLVVEDEPAVRALEVTILQRCGYRVLEAANGQEALQVAAQEPGPIHLLVTDVVMPHLGGRALAEQIVAYHPDCRVLFLSGYTPDEDRRPGTPTVPTAVLQKPFVPTTLAQQVRCLLDKVTQG